PASLAVWHRLGEPAAEIRLASVDLPPSLLAALVRSPETARGPRVERLERSPGVHYVLVAPLAGGDVLTVGVGPHTRLIPSARVARFLQGEVGVEPPYEIRLSPPSPPPAAPSARVIWTRQGWSARGERRIPVPGGLVSHVHLTVELRDPWALLVRGALVVVIDVALLAACWLLSLALTGRWRPRLPPIFAVLRTSYRARLAVALAGFFVVPLLVLALWSFARLRDDARQDGDLLIGQTLRDAAGTAASLASEPGAALGRSMAELGNRLDADLWLYRDGVLAATTAPVLAELGVVDPFLAPDPFVRLALRDELERTADSRVAGRTIRVGYLVVVSESPQVQGVLAAPQLLDDERVRQQQEDLALGLALATLAGLVAAVASAGVVARGLARPVAALQEAAGAMDRGGRVPPLPLGARRRARVRRGSPADPRAARVPRAGSGRLRGGARRRHGSHPRGARAGVGRDGPPGRARDQESAHAHPSGHPASAAGPRQARRPRLRRHVGRDCGADPRGNRPARRDRPGVLALRLAPGRSAAARAGGRVRRGSGGRPPLYVGRRGGGGPCGACGRGGPAGARPPRRGQGGARQPT